MKMPFSVIVPAALGVAFGILSNYVALLHGAWANLLLWTAIGLLIGLYIDERAYVRSAGVSYGFFLVLAFLVSGFHGSADKIGTFAVLSIVLCIAGGLCGWSLIWAGNWLKRKFT